MVLRAAEQSCLSARRMIWVKEVDLDRFVLFVFVCDLHRRKKTARRRLRGLAGHAPDLDFSGRGSALVRRDGGVDEVIRVERGR